MIIEKQNPASLDAKKDSEPLEPPPSYTPKSKDNSSPGAGPSTQADGDLTPVNGLVVATRYESIKGTWLIDPFAPNSTPSLLTSFVSHRNSRAGRRQRERELGNRTTLTLPAASLDSHFGSITARLAIVGKAEHPARAGVKVTTRHGHISVDLFEKATSKFVDLDVYSRSGHAVVMIPRSFSGVVELRSRRGAAFVLPHLSTAVRIVKAVEREVTVLVGDSGQAAGAAAQFADHVRIYSREGDVRVGFSGEDYHVHPEGLLSMFMKKMSRKI